MPESAVIAIARVPLARSLRRLVIAPLVLLAIGLIAAVAGLLRIPALEAWALLAAAAAAAALALYLLAVLTTVRLDVEVSALRLRWIGTDRRYALVRGAVTRVPLSGERAVKLRPRVGFFGWGLGTARLRGQETIQLVRLARTPAIILVPTDAGRIAVAPSSEQQFLEALAAAARVQQRLDQVAARARSIPIARPSEEIAAAPEPELVDVMQRPLTGIERTLLEERLAAERAAALAAAEAERRANELAASRAAQTAAPAAPGEASPLPRDEVRRRAPLPRFAIPRPHLRAPQAIPRGRALSLLTAAVPLVAAVVLWAAGTLAGTLDRGPIQLEQLSIGLALAGPVAALAALAARAWFPRLLGLVVVTAACTLILLGRSLLG
jgi:hypothetical protein